MKLEVLGPAPSVITRIQGQARFQVLLRSNHRGSLRVLLDSIRKELGARGSGRQRTVAIADVDPQHLT